MIEAQIILLRPLWLIALPVLAVIALWLLRRRSSLGGWEQAARPYLLKALGALGKIEGSEHRAPFWAAIAAAAIAIVGLTGPAIERRDALSFRNLDGVLFLIDASSSVVEDIRWPQVQTMGRFGLAALGTRPGGLIVFAGDAYVATEMTTDHLQLGQTFSLINANTVPDEGSRPERALELAVRLLSDADVIAGDVIVFTDGSGLGPASLQASAKIAELGSRLSLVSLTDNVADIQTHASVGGGRVFSLVETEELSNWLREDARTRLEAQDYPLLFWQDYGRYLLFVMAIPVLFLFRRQEP